MDKYYIVEVAKNIKTGAIEIDITLDDHVIGPPRLHDQSGLIDRLKIFNPKLIAFHFYGSEEEYEFLEGLLLITGVSIPLVHKKNPLNLKYPISGLDDFLYRTLIIFPEHML